MSYRDGTCHDCHQLTSGDCGQHEPRIKPNFSWSFDAECLECPRLHERIATLERELEEQKERNKNLGLTLDLYQSPHVTMTVSYAEELKKSLDDRVKSLLAERDADRAAIRDATQLVEELAFAGVEFQDDRIGHMTIQVSLYAKSDAHLFLSKYAAIIARATENSPEC